MTDMKRRRSVAPTTEPEFAPWDVRASRAEAENQRLRTAMVHAVDECDHEAACTDSDITRNSLRRVAKHLKTALEKK